MQVIKELLDAFPYIEELTIRSLLLLGTAITLIKAMFNNKTNS